MGTFGGAAGRSTRSFRIGSSWCVGRVIATTGVCAFALLACSTPRSALREFDADTMTRPVQLAGPPIRYSKEALEHHVEGLCIAACIIQKDGTLTDCEIRKSLPYMDEAILETLRQRRYRPVTYRGEPVSVPYVFNTRIMLPRPDIHLGPLFPPLRAPAPSATPL